LSLSRFYGGYLFAFQQNVSRRAGRLEKKTIQVENHKIYYLEGGKGDSILLLHGFGGDKSNWTPLSRHLTTTYRVIAPDLPGFGESTKIWSEKYDIQSQVGRIHRFVQQIGLQRFHIAGSSMGGLIAGVYAATYPDEIVTLGLFDPGGVADREPSQLTLGLEQGINHLIVKTPAQYDQLLSFVCEHPPRIPLSIQQYLGEVAAKSGAFNEKVFVEAKPGDQLESRMADIVAKTLIVWGDKDKVFPASSAEVLHKGIANSKVVILKECGHLPMLEKSRETANLYLDFIK
jgi:pimeloyl-ACP methyl ester carboxylesterase